MTFFSDTNKADEFFWLKQKEADDLLWTTTTPMTFFLVETKEADGNFFGKQNKADDLFFG